MLYICPVQQTRLTEVQEEIHSLENKLARASQAESAETKADSLDAYMKSVGDHLDTTKKLEIKHSLHDLKKEEKRLQKLIEMTKPVDLPRLIRYMLSLHGWQWFHLDCNSGSVILFCVVGNFARCHFCLFC